MRLPVLRAGPAALRGAASDAGAITPDRLIAAGVAGLGVASAIMLARAAGDWRFAVGFLVGFAAIAAAIVLAARMRIAAPTAAPGAQPDRMLMRAALDVTDRPAAVTDRSGRMVAANAAYLDRFGAQAAPPTMRGLELYAEAIAGAGRSAWRDGAAELRLDNPAAQLKVARVGLGEDHLLWQIAEGRGEGRTDALRLIGGAFGDRLGLAGLMAALIDERGRILVSNKVFAARVSGGHAAAVTGRDFASCFRQEADGALRFVRDRDDGDPLRLLHIPLDDGELAAGAAAMLLFDDPVRATAEPATRPDDLFGLLGMLPLGLALIDRDGRFLFLNDSFRAAAGVGPQEQAVYPSDLVVKEDKSAVSDAVRRFAGVRGGGQASGPLLSGDVAVRLRHRPDEPVSLTVASARGLGDAAVLLSLKDSAEENRLQRQVAQATKMQAVGQLAGGVAHDFNNILTAVLGHCDLILMRHTPGDSDYDDIQQIRHNANRAAGLTRQLLAFSRQQTLRPQVLQLPDVVSEVSNLLRRLVGETMQLVINHGRAIGPVRADPGQLEQVIVNLAVNARDAMPEGGTLTIRTYGVSAAEVRRLGADVLPAGDYSAISVTDTGTGIPPEVLPKIFEPFFTTKDVGKGTGLGLSTVYGIVKQSGGFIFADSEPGRGTSFVIYLPVFRGEVAPAEAAAGAAKPASQEIWGTGRILVVEDEDMVRSVAERALTRQGYQVSSAANGEEALELLAQVTADPAAAGFDLLISDVMMPTMDGPTMVAHARRDFPDLPILFMSGYAEEQLRKSIDLDNVSFLAKPFSVQQLAEAARDALARNRAAAQR